MEASARTAKEEEYLKQKERKIRAAMLRKHLQIRQALHIGNPILRQAIKRDKEAARTDRAYQFQGVLMQSREQERQAMIAEDRVTWRQPVSG